MKLPTPLGNKSPEMKKALEDMFPALKKGGCPTCGKPIVPEDFRDALSIKEYGISGMCQECQDSIWGKK